MSEFEYAADLAELEATGLLGVWVEDTAVLLSLVDGEVHAINDICSHAHAHLSDGERHGPQVECLLHGARFDLRTGRHLCSPAYVDVDHYEVKVEDGKVYVRLED